MNRIFILDFQMNDTSIIAAYAFIAACLVCVGLRFLLCIFYNITRQGFTMFQKEVLKKKADPKTFKTPFSPTLTKIINDYTSIGEKGIANIDTKGIVENRISRLGMLGINYKSLEEFITKFELAAPVIGIVLMFMYDNPMGFGAFSIISFVAFRVIAVFLNFELIRSQLTSDIVSYIDREIGQYYIGDISGAIGRLKVELVVAVSNIGTYVEKAMERVEQSFATNIKTAMDEIANNVNFTMESLSKYTEYMDTPFESWREAVNSAASAQQGMYNALDDFLASATDYTSIQKDLNISLNGFLKASDNQVNALKSMTSELSSSADFARKEYSNIEALNTLITAQVKVFTDNQQILEKSVVSYEQSLKEITSNLSDGLGIILKHHMSEAYSELNDSLKDNINAITVSNAQVLHKLDVLLDELYKQSNK